MHFREQRRRDRRPALAAAMIAALIALPAVAQDTAKKTAPPKSTAKANLMTRDELRACMNEQDRLQAIRTRIQQDNAELDRQQAAVLAMDDELKKKASALDPGDEAARKALEDEAVRRDRAAAAYNAGTASLRQQGQEYDTARQAWTQKCGNRNFDEMDEAAIKKERAQAARAAKK